MNLPKHPRSSQYPPAARPHTRQASGTPVVHAPTYAEQRADAARRRANGEQPLPSTPPAAKRSTYTSYAAQSKRTDAAAAKNPLADVANAVRGVKPKRTGDHGPSKRVTTVVAAVAAAAVVFGALGYCYATMWRNIEVTVNGAATQIRIGSSVEDLLEQNDYFGVQPGRLMSVGGNVLEEAGGDRATVKQGEDVVPAADYGTTKVEEGSSLTVENGGDATEPHTEEKVALAPGMQMGKGGAIQYVQQWGKAGEKVVWHGEKSGEAVDHEVTTQPQDMIVASVNPEPKGKKKYMALTFDDGPSKYTQAILDILKEKGAKATFYNLGTSSANFPDLTKAVVEGGHELASHTNQHQNLPKLDRDGLRNEITSAFDTLEKNGGARPQMMRAPYGAFTATEWARSGDIISCNVLWNIDTLDWKLPGAAAITDQVLSHAYNGAIALMHDGGGNRQQDVDALPGIIDGLHDAGYELVTVSELMKLDGRFPEDVVNGTVKMPEDAALPQM